jgi:hypothetical protein
MTQFVHRKRKWPLIACILVLLGSILLLFVLPAERGWDPTGIGRMTGLTSIAEPGNPELERGKERMARQELLSLGDMPAVPGTGDVWEHQLAPFESVEFKYTIPEGEPITFRWQSTGTLSYDMHAHPFMGGEELTESYGIGEARLMQGRYVPAFTGIHGWFWENRTMDDVMLRLEASGSMTHSTIFARDARGERPLEGVAAAPQGPVAGHEMQGVK